MQPPTLLRMMHSAVQCLSSSDQVVLANVFHTYENTCVTTKNAQIPSFPAVQHTSLHQFLNEISFLLPVFLEYVKYIPEFAKISIDDKIRLVKNHFSDLLSINAPLLYPGISNNLILTWTTVFGIDITTRLVKHNQIIELYTVDPILLKLLVIILLLSSSNDRNLDRTDIDDICDDTLSIFAAQNIYVELLWGYILSRSSTECDAVKFLNKLIMFILYTKSLNMNIDSYINGFKDELEQVEPMIQNMWSKSSDEETTTDVIRQH